MMKNSDEKEVGTMQVVEPEATNETPEPRPVKQKRFMRSPLIVLGGAFALALLMWAFNFQPVSSDTNKLIAVYAPDVNNFLDFKSSVWDEGRTWANHGNKPVETTVVPLSGQFYIKENGGSVLQVKARAAHNGKDMAVWMQWQDPTENVTGPSADLVKTFSDAAAVEFPMEVIPGRQPFRCMGQPDALVNIWQWKAERDAELTRQAGFEPVRTNYNEQKAAKNYVGPNAAYLIDPSRDDPDTKAMYDPNTKTWTLIFKRSLETTDKKVATQFRSTIAGIGTATSGGGAAFVTQIAFAIWDGGNGERLSKKAVSTWVDIALDEGDNSPQFLGNVVNLGIMGLIVIVSLFLCWRFLPSANRIGGNR